MTLLELKTNFVEFFKVAGLGLAAYIIVALIIWSVQPAMNYTTLESRTAAHNQQMEMEALHTEFGK